MYLLDRLDIDMFDKFPTNIKFYPIEASEVIYLTKVEYNLNNNCHYPLNIADSAIFSKIEYVLTDKSVVILEKVFGKKICCSNKSVKLSRGDRAILVKIDNVLNVQFFVMDIT